MTKESIMKKITIKRFYYAEWMLVTVWLAYLIKFYTFYKEAYFYVDKRLSLLLQLLSFFSDNWEETFWYLLIGFLLMAITLFLTSFIYQSKIATATKRKSFYLIVCLNMLCIFPLFFNIVGALFFILLILAASVTYVVFILANVSWDQEMREYEVGDIIETKGPFDTKEAAESEMLEFFSKWKEKKDIILGEEIYSDADNKYYAEIYIEEGKKTNIKLQE